MRPPGTSGRRLLRHHHLVGGLLIAASVGCLALWGAGTDRGAGATGAGITGPGSTLTSAPAAGPHASARHSHRQAGPVRLAIPSIGVATPLVGLGLQADRSVQVPADPAEAGWYSLGTRPGAWGSAVILGHVDSDAGPAVFYRLAQVKVGARILVARSDRSIAAFVVHSVRTYPNADFPARRVYASRGHRQLDLITCGGDYDPDRGGYQANVVVDARWVFTRPA